MEVEGGQGEGRGAGVGGRKWGVSTVGRITSPTAAGSSSAASNAHVREPAGSAAVPSAAHELIQRGRYVFKAEPAGSLQSFEWRQRFIAKWVEHAKLAYELKTLRRDTRDTARAALGERLAARYCDS